MSPHTVFVSVVSLLIVYFQNVCFFLNFLNLQFGQFLYSLLITFDAVMVFFTFLSWGIKNVLKVLKL